VLRGHNLVPEKSLMNRFVRTVFLCALLALPLSASRALARPNVLLIVADDLCWRDLGCLGNADVRTPQIDTLAASGMRLEGMFSDSATCSPTRHALYTGLHPVRSGAYPNHTFVHDGCKSIFTYLRDAGYRVGLQGKKHILPASSFPFETISNDPDEADAFRRFITDGSDKPWFAVFASNDPHSPWNRGPRELYDPAKLKIPPYLHDNEVTRRNLAAYYAEISQLDAQVGACLNAIAESGQENNTLVVFLSEQGSSFPYGGKWTLYDNGIHAAAFVRWPGHIQPGSRSDALIQYVDLVPTLLEAAGIDPATIDTGCADAAGNRGFDGRSFLGVLLDQRREHREYVFAQHTTVGVNGFKDPYPSRAARDSRFKLIRNLLPQNTFWIDGIQGSDVFDSWQVDAARDPALAERLHFLSHRPAEELYDLQQDPYETRNLADDPKLAAVKRRLSDQLEAWMKQQGDRGVETELDARSRQPASRAVK
jgi:N-sulfoglucosamine sulfohydrolase